MLSPTDWSGGAIQNFRDKAVSVAYVAKRPSTHWQGELGEELLNRNKRKQTEEKRKTKKKKIEIKDMQKFKQGIRYKVSTKAHKKGNWPQKQKAKNIAEAI